jgi:hypothetical protein
VKLPNNAQGGAAEAVEGRRPAKGAGPLYRGTPIRISRDMSRVGECLMRHVASLPLASDGTCPENEGLRDG